MTHPNRPAPRAAALLHPWRAWERFWFTPVDPATACFIRACAASVALYVAVCYCWGLLSYFGPGAWFDEALARRYLVFESFAPGWGWDEAQLPVGWRQQYWSVFFHVTSPAWIWALQACIIAAAGLYALGLWCRWTGVATWLGLMCCTQRSWMTVFGLDTMLMIVLAYLLIAPTGACFSLDRLLAVRRARRRGEPEPAVEPSAAANFAVRLIQVHFCVIYLAGGLSKLQGPSWWNGTAVSQVLLSPVFAPTDSPPYYHLFYFLSRHRWLWEALTSSMNLYTIALEVGFIFLVWDQRWRWLMVLASALMHLGIGLFLGLSTFSLMMLIMLSSFFTPATVRAVVAQTAEALGGLRRRAAPAVPQAPQAAALTR